MKEIYLFSSFIEKRTNSTFLLLAECTFISKLSISLKEARETKYWIELLRETDYLTDKEANNILEDLIEVIKLLVSIIKTTKENHAK